MQQWPQTNLWPAPGRTCERLTAGWPMPDFLHWCTVVATAFRYCGSCVCKKWWHIIGAEASPHFNCIEDCGLNLFWQIWAWVINRVITLSPASLWILLNSTINLSYIVKHPYNLLLQHAKITICCLVCHLFLQNASLGNVHLNQSSLLGKSGCNPKHLTWE